MTNGRGQGKGKNQQANNSQPIVKQMTSMNSNTTKAIKSSIVEQNPYLAEFIEQLFSLTLNDKPVDVRKAKFNDSIEVLVFNEQIWFYRPEKNAPFLPTLHFAHRFPQIFPQLQTDDNAAGFILNGADVMARGIHKITDSDIRFSINNTINFQQQILFCNLSRLPTFSFKSFEKNDFDIFNSDSIWSFIMSRGTLKDRLSYLSID
ncbi:MAG: Malignant T-cell-amplified sequence 1 [Marteilia pararefringens]